ncbi:facilitated trehalose transporter Tret1-2 homolog [Anabrus simplex]|uniref:facilitated trehalose transporter Tret1-2 homolog n=1 Tax=Anabrus simplex TaxID=316456 RepID=UPI0035A2E581
MEQDTRPEEAPMLTGNSAKVAQSQGSANNNEDVPADGPRSNSRSLYAQTLVAGAVFLLTAGCGFPIGFSAVLLPQLKDPNSTLLTDDDMGSWIASIHSAATPIGSFMSGMLMDRWGRRTALQVTAIPFTVGWIIIALAGSHAVLLVGRVAAGLAVGLSAAPSQVFISEVAEPRIRGLLAGTPMVSYSLGILVVYALGATLPWRTVAWLGIILPALSLAAFSFLPESPTWLARKGRVDDAERSLRWLRGGGAGIQAKKELQQLLNRLRAEEDARRTEGMESDAHIAPESCFEMYSKPNIYKPFLIVNVFNMLQIFSGTFLVIFYAVDVISETETKGEGMDKFVAAVLTAVVRLIFTAVACCLLMWIGRRPLAIGSGLCSGITAVILGTILYIKNIRDPTEEPIIPYSEVIITCVLLYMATNTCGFFVLPGITIGELLPAKIRGLAGGYIFAAFNLGLFFAAKLFPQIMEGIGAHGMFWIFGGSSLLGTLFVYLMLPETKGQSLAQIEDYFLGPNILWITRNKYQSAVATKV